MDAIIPTTISSDELDFLSTIPGTWDNKIIDSKKLARNIKLTDLSRWNSSAQSTACSLGDLNKLSLEMMLNIASNLDLRTLFTFRALNSWFKTAIEQWKPFRDIMQYGQNAVRAMIVTDADRLWTAPQLCAVLFTSRCELCGEHGEILQLLKLMRCCFHCLTTEVRLLAVNSIFLTHTTGLNVPPGAAEHIPRLLVMQRSDFWGGSTIAPNQCVFDYTTAVQYRAAIAPTPPSQLFILGKRARTHADHPEHQKLINAINHLHLPQPGMHPERFMAAVHQPAMFNDKSTNQPHTVHASYCTGCRHYWNYRSPHHWTTHTLYPADELLAHIRNCTYAQLWWTKLHPDFSSRPSAALTATVHTVSMLTCHRKPSFHIPRHTDHLVRNNAEFELIPFKMLMHLARTGHNAYTKLYGNLAEPWDGYRVVDSVTGLPPVSPLGHGVIFSRADGTVHADATAHHIASLNPLDDFYVFGGLGPDADGALSAAAVQGKKKKKTKDWYADVLLGDEAAGNAQATWATATVCSTSYLFLGPVGLMGDRWRREDARVKRDGGRGLRGQWGFDRL